MVPLLKTYKIFSKPTKKLLVKKKDLISLKKKSSQSIFFILTVQQLYKLELTKLQSGILLFKIN